MDGGRLVSSVMRTALPDLGIADVNMLEHFSYRCRGAGGDLCGFSLKKSHVEWIWALYIITRNALRGSPGSILADYRTASISTLNADVALQHFPVAHGRTVLMARDAPEFATE
jgi:hypothetical protein